MRKYNKYTQTVLLAIPLTLFLAGAVYAEKEDKNERINPLGCVDVGYKFALKTLNILPEEAGTRNSLYFILNKSSQAINLYQMRDDESTQIMFLNHAIDANRWAVLSTCEKEVNYICTVDDKKSKYGKIVDCADNLQVCEFARVRFGLNNRGNQWIVKGNTRSGAVREVVRYGIIPQ